MRSLSLTLCAVVAATGAAIAAPTSAFATDKPLPPGTLFVSPANAQPGDGVELRVWGCESRTGTAISKAFVVDAQLAPAGGQSGGGLYAEATIRSAAAGGIYDITVRCDGRDGVAKANVHVGAVGFRRDRDPQHYQQQSRQYGQRHDEPQHHPDAFGRPDGFVRVQPIGPVQAGGGGAADKTRKPADDKRMAAADGLDGAEVYGLALAGGTALTLGGLALHRRGRSGRSVG
ncbi:hypothetical protein [Streptomyces zagrosensis]|uniref:Gram-positive cocci surface proteins LPxTG domain-containing protein n=1 Tax=Streptomyces zagrosensis TaxID=1042984 RepID=A0A7W9Q8J4_9ACTN|nr:hypothetical protein [Streptomyces zagrosensis]MBB5935158.1 hypothetical protein [Streptomyces zagrosensis]